MGTAVRIAVPLSRLNMARHVQDPLRSERLAPSPEHIFAFQGSVASPLSEVWEKKHG
jgi:hypothetical protein